MANHPNIVYVLADDQGYGDVGCFNPNCKAPTPVLDLMADEGMRFTDSHTSSAVCTPTRYGVLTGRYNWRSRLKSGVLTGESPALLEEGRETVASYLQTNGYRTACVGKWKLLEARGSGGWSYPKEEEAGDLGLPECQLYDMERDPGETTNLAPGMPEKEEELRRLLGRCREGPRTAPR